MSFTVSSIIAAVKRDGSITFAALAKDIEAGAAAVVRLLGPTAQAFADQEVSTAKQFASDAITMADSYLGSHQQAIALAVEQAIDTELTVLTRGASLPFALNGLTSAGVDQLVAAAVAAAHNAGLLIKARLATQGGLQGQTVQPTLSAPPPQG
jgi:hypothetical protein